MIFKTLLLAATIAFASDTEKITIKIVKTEKSKDSSVETTLYEITPALLAYTYTRTGKKEAKQTQSAYLSKTEYREIRNKYFEMELNRNLTQESPASEMLSMELTTSARLDSISNGLVSGKPDEVKANPHYKKVKKFIEWLKLFKPL